MARVTTAPARGRVRTMTAGIRVDERDPVGEDAARASAHGPGAELLRGGPGWIRLHRWLIARDVENVVVDSSSIEVNRRARRRHRLDVGKLLALLLRWLGGERKVWSVVHVPSPEAEAQRQLTREIATVREDRKRVRNRIQSLLAQGIRLALSAGFVEHLTTGQTGDGRALPTGFRLQLARDRAHLEAIEARMNGPHEGNQRDMFGHRGLAGFFFLASCACPFPQITIGIWRCCILQCKCLEEGGAGAECQRFIC